MTFGRSTIAALLLMRAVATGALANDESLLDAAPNYMYSAVL